MTTSIELLPRTGIAIDGFGAVEFGMTHDEVRALFPADSFRRAGTCMALSTAGYDELRDAHDAWFEGALEEPDWIFAVDLGEVSLRFDCDGPGRLDRLGRIEVARVPTPPPVTLDGLDLFGRPAEELGTILPVTPAANGWTDVEPLGLRLNHVTRDGHWSTACLFGPRPRGWDACCDGELACAKDGDGLVGVLYASEDRPPKAHGR